MICLYIHLNRRHSIAWQASTYRNKHKFPILSISQLACVKAPEGEKGVFDDSHIIPAFL